ncbi:CDP-alcohol phosphatidyltransferase family protein [Fodinicola acaciae]|uniref:CDP-alcohol phosphatidyltransferase family protein n=1 Tax=Fodinicola acaciae TaxID=2681555 RepID=UPI0013D48CCE|nr:CDP-alcohol phosphatidyltransferase family protein [Fodinicola acaciae]
MVGNSVFTVPNLLSFIRLLGVPVFLYLVLVPEDHRVTDLIAIAVLVGSGISDYLDGFLARRWNQVSRLGQLLDPSADALYMISTLYALAMREIIPWWFAIALIAREVFMFALLPVLRYHGYGPLPVHWLGKAATFVLMYGFPLLLLSVQPGVAGRIAGPIAWAFAIWGACLFYWAAGLYAVQAATVIREARCAARKQVSG